MRGQDGSKEHAEQRAAESANKHDQPDCDWTHTTLPGDDTLIAGRRRL